MVPPGIKTTSCLVHIHHRICEEIANDRLFLSNLAFPSVQGHIGAANGFAKFLLAPLLPVHHLVMN